MPAVSKKQQRFAGMVHAAQQGEKPASPAVAKAAKSWEPSDVEKTASTSTKGLPDKVKKESTIGQIISRYNEYAQHLHGGQSMRELAEDLMEIAEFAEQAIMSESDDWYDAHTISRNMKEIKSYVKEFAKIAEEHDSLKSRAGALYDDMGRVLERYFDVAEDYHDPHGPAKEIGYDTDDDGVDDLVAGNSPKNPVEGDEADQMAHEASSKYDNRTNITDIEAHEGYDMDDIDESGERFRKLVRSLAHRGKNNEGIDEAFMTFMDEYTVHNPKALAAWIGRRKYGKEKFQHMAAAGKKHENANALTEKKPALGSGGRFKDLVKQLKAKNEEFANLDENELSELAYNFMQEYTVHNPKALAAWIGRKKYGKEKFQHMAAAGKKHENRGPIEDPYMGNDVAMREARNKDLAERLVKLARAKLKGEQLVEFDTLPRATQIRAAWKIIR